MNFAKSILIVLLLCSSCFADTTPVAEYHKAVIHCGQEIGGGSSFAGSGTLICREGGGIVLSAGHIFEGSGNCWVDYGQGRRVYATLLGRDERLDLAVLKTAAPPADIPVIPLANKDEYPPGGSTVEFVGFGGGQFRHFTTTAAGYKERNGKFSQLAMNFISISGDSGGPVIYNGKVVAVQWGHDGTNSQGTVCGHIQTFLTQWQVPICRDNSCSQPIVRPIQQQPPLATVPPKPVTPAKPCNCDNAALLARITILEAELVTLKSRPQVAGPPGPAGPAGPQGAKGDTGATPAIDPNELAKQLPPIQFQRFDDGKLIPDGTRSVHLGGVVKLGNHSEVKK